MIKQVKDVQIGEYIHSLSLGYVKVFTKKQRHDNSVALKVLNDGSRRPFWLTYNSEADIAVTKEAPEIQSERRIQYWERKV